MSDLQNVAKKVGAEFEAMLQAGTMPVFELECQDKTGERDWYIIEVSIDDEGIIFYTPDSSIPSYFSCNVKKISGCTFLYQFDEYFDNLDYYLSEIHQEITEGYFIPNGFEILS